jgi:polysaccharide biosynthesis/export protein
MLPDRFSPSRWGVFLTACAGLWLGIPAAAQTAGSVPQATTTPAPAGNAARLKIGPGDLLELSVFDEPELAQSVRVSDTGTAELSLVGTVHFAGLTTSEAQALVENQLRERNFLLHPHVNILIREYSTQGVSILGEIKNPGVYPILGSRNLLDLLSQAGGVTSLASNQAIIKHRSGNEENVVTDISRNNPQQLLASSVDIGPGDTIFVPRAGIVYVLGDVGRPGGYVMQDDGKMTLLQAVSMAAGTLKTASEGKTRLLEKTPAGNFQERPVDLKKVIRGEAQDIQLQPEDIVYVPASTAKTIFLNGPQLAQSAASAVVYHGVTAIP